MASVVGYRPSAGSRHTRTGREHRLVKVGFGVFTQVIAGPDRAAEDR